MSKKNPIPAKHKINEINENSLYNLVIMLKMFKRDDPFYKRGMDRWVRAITQQGQSYQMTPALENALNESDITFEGGLVPHSKKQSLSTKLKSKFGSEYGIIIEHWHKIQWIKEDLNNMSLPDDTDDAIKQVRNYFEKYTHCFMRLTKEDVLQPTSDNRIKYIQK